MNRLRHADEWIGLLVLLAVLLAIAAALQANVLSHWFRPTSTLRILLPEEGVAGLSEGAEVEVLGTRAGTVRRVVINPAEQMYAEAEIEDQLRAFIRRDSKAVIRRQFGVAGAAYIDISRGTGEKLDWNYAVIRAVTERNPTEGIGTLIDQVRQKVFPILDDTGRATHTLADIMGRVAKGQGNIGHLLVDDSLMKQAEATVADLHASVAKIGPIMAQLQQATRDIADLAKTADARDSGMPALLKRLGTILATLQETMRNLSEASRRLPRVVRNVESGTASLPALLTETQQTVHQLDGLIVQLRGSWLLGGGGPQKPPPLRLPPTEVQP